MVKDAVHTYLREVALTNKELITLSQEEFHQEWSNFLNKFFPYYRNLDNDGQIAFCNKTQALLKRIDIVGIDIEVDASKRVLIMASLAQLTFGLKKLGLYNFKEIRLYKDTFHLKKTDSFYDGITYSSKIIALSWSNYERGILNQTDGINLGIYHHAEALLRTVNNGIFFDTHFASYIDDWTEHVESAFKQNQKFRELINTNDRDNFFPRISEIFFERPFELKEISNDVYAHTCVLLNQNPLNITENYKHSVESLNRLNLLTTVPVKVRKIYRHHKWHWSYNLTVFMPILAPIGIYMCMIDALITDFHFGLAYLIISVVFYTALYRLNKKFELYSHQIWLYVFCLMGLTPLTLTTLLYLNNNIIVGATQKSIHKIESYTFLIREARRGNNYSYTGVILDYDDLFLNKYYRARKFEYDDLPTKTFTNYSAEYKIAKGLLGIDVVLSKKITYTP